MRPSRGFVLTIAVLALAAAGKAVLYDTLDPDCFWHLRVAAQLERDGVGSLVDEISFASIKQSWTPYSWLAELGMKALWDSAGWRAAVLAQALGQVFARESWDRERISAELAVGTWPRIARDVLDFFEEILVQRATSPAFSLKVPGVPW